MACKVIPFHQQDADREIKILQTLPKHPNVVTFHRAYRKARNLYIFLELCDQGDMTEFIRRRSYRNQETEFAVLTTSEAQYVVRSIVEGLAFLGQNRIMHRDIKLDNIFVKLKDGYRITSRK